MNEHGPVPRSVDAASERGRQPVEAAPAPRAPGREVAALALIVLLAAALRFSGLDWGLRHPPFSDERSFVEATAGMLARGDFDHRFYEYPGLFLYMVRPLVGALPPEARTGPAAYLAARRLVAAFGVASVALVFVLGRRLAGGRVGLVAALVLAVSPVDVATAHMIRPDVVMGAFVLLALVSFDRLEPRSGDALAGVSLGLAASVKFTGLLLVPSYLLRRALVPGRRLRGLLQAGLASALVATLATPYALLRPAEFTRGARYQVMAHYRGQAAPAWDDNLAYYLQTAERALGPAGALLALGGLVLAWRNWRRWAPSLLFLLGLVATMSTAGLRFPRFLVPASGVLALVVALALEALARRSRLLAAAATLVAVLPPLGAAAHYARKSAQPSPRDAALDWIGAHVPPGARILDLCRDLSFGLDARRYEVLEARPKAARVGWLAAEMDLVVAYPDAAARLADFETALRVRADRGEAPFHLLVPRPERRRRPVALPLDAARVRVSSGAERLAALLDGDDATVWTAAPRAAPSGHWIEVRFAQPQRLARVELCLGVPPHPCDGDLGVLMSLDGARWETAAALATRPAPAAQLGRRSQALVMATPAVRALRITCPDHGRQAWEVAGLSLAAPRAATGAAAVSR
jgi:hypothetical protein